MFRASFLFRLSLLATCAPPHFASSTDIAFYFPRFQPSTHVQSAGIPEIKEAVALLASQTIQVALPSPADLDRSHWRQREEGTHAHRLVKSKRWLSVGKAFSRESHSSAASVSASSIAEKTMCLQLIDRGIDILECAGGLEVSAIREVLLPLYATKWELLQGTAHLPRPTFDYTTYASGSTARGSGSVGHSSTCYRGGVLHVPKHILYHTSRVLVKDDHWSLESGGFLSPQKIDTDCMVLAHFVKAFSLLHTRPFNQSSAKSNPATSPTYSGSGQRQGGSLKSTHSGSRFTPHSYASANKSSWSLTIENNGGGDKGIMTLEIALKRVDQLIERCKAAMQEASKKKKTTADGASSSATPGSSNGHAEGREGGEAPLPDSGWDVLDSWKFYIPKLLLLKAILTIGYSGHLLHAKKCVDEAAAYVHGLQKRSHILLDGLREGERPAEPELGMFLLAQAEMMARIWNWGGGKLIQARKTSTREEDDSSSSSRGNGETNAMVAELDEDVFEAFDNSAGFYAAPFTSNTKADGIMDLSLVAEREFEVHAYAVCVLSLATVILGVPRVASTSNSVVASLFASHTGSKQKESPPMFSAVHQDSKPVFLSQQLFSLHPPLLSLDCPSLITFSDSSRLRPFSVEEARRMAGVLLKRALELVRALYPDDRDHPLAVQILTAMACLYADTRDYLYASGLFESARRGTYMHYGGPRSIEGIFVDKLRYEFLAGVGSEEEAKTAGHEIVQHLREVDQLPVV